MIQNYLIKTRILKGIVPIKSILTKELNFLYSVKHMIGTQQVLIKNFLNPTLCNNVVNIIYHMNFTMRFFTRYLWRTLSSAIMTLGNKLIIKILVKGIHWYSISFSVLYLISVKFSLSNLSLEQLADYSFSWNIMPKAFFFFCKQQNPVKTVRRYELNIYLLFW